MWLLARLMIAIGAFLIKILAKRNRFIKTEPRHLNGHEYFMQTETTKHGRITDTIFAFKFNCKAIFKLTKEGGFDSFFKSVGLAEEVQSGDQEFDQKIYVASDNYGFCKEIKSDAKTRKLILQLFEKGCEYIKCDGAEMWVSFPKDERTNMELVTLFTELKLSMTDINRTYAGWAIDLFAVKVLIVEAIVWSLVAYAGTGFFEWYWVKEDRFLDIKPVLKYAAVAGFFVFAILIYLIAFFLKGSSRGHRILIESGVVLIIALSAGSVTMVSDLDIQLDKSTSVYVDAEVEGTFTREHRSRKGRSKWYSYHMQIKSPKDNLGFDIPTQIEISRKTYEELKKDSWARIEIGRGWLGIPWYRSIKPTTDY